MAIWDPQRLYLLLAYCTPLSLNLENLTGLGGIGFYLPTEPFLFALMLLVFAKILSNYKWDNKILYHPIAIAIYLNLLWILVTCVTSTMPLVSFKFLLSRLWYILVCFILVAHFFKNPEYFSRFAKYFLLGLSTVIVITIIKHAQRGFDEQVGHYIMGPFFKDHTSYGAVIAMFIPISLAFLVNPKRFKIKKLLSLVVFTILTAGIILSYTRAAWISLVLALAVYIIIKLRIKFSLLLLATIIFGGLIFTFQNEIIRSLERNEQDSSSNFSEHIQSISNITTDASNVERLNRWNCAIRMFEEKPIFGWGPGTYMFKYAPFQKKSEKTWISTNRGTLGNAHSEYLGPLSESGLLGLLSFLGIVIVVFYRGINALSRYKPGLEKSLLLCSILGLVTYLGHGLLNNFLDTDKAGIPFWSFVAMIVVLDIRSEFNGNDTKAG